MREINKVFVPVYTELLRNKKYAQRFDSRAVGTMYRLLAANIWRLDTSDTAARGYRGEVFSTLANEYENGNLVSYYDDKQLAETLGVTQRYIRKLRSQLIELGLIEARQVENGAAKYYYKLGEVVAKDSYGYMHEILYIDKWLADIAAVKKGKKTVPEFEAALDQLSNNGKDVTVSEFSHESLTKLHNQIMEQASSIFLGGAGTTVPEGRNYSSGQAQCTDSVQDDKKQEFSDNTNKMKYTTSLSSKEEIYKQTPTSKKKKQKPTEAQYSLFGHIEEKPNYAEQLDENLRTNLEKAYRTIIKLVKENGITDSKRIVSVLLNSHGVQSPQIDDKEFFVKSWEALASARVKLVPQKYLSANSFLTGWWMMHTLDVDAPGRRKNISHIRAIFANFVEKHSGDIDEIIGTIQFMRKFLADKKSATMLFTRPEHMYSALETYLAYYRERQKKKAEQPATDIQKNAEQGVDIVCESDKMELQPGEIDSWTVDTHKNVLKSKKYLPKYLHGLSLMQKFDLWKEGYFTDALIPKAAYRDQSVPKKCWLEMEIVEAEFITITYWRDPVGDPVLNECMLRKFVKHYSEGTWERYAIHCTEDEYDALAEELSGD